MKTVKSKWTIGEALKQKADENNGSQALVRRSSSVRELTVNAATFAALTAMLVIGMPARAAGNVNVNGNKLQCFSGTTDGDQGGVTYGGTCSLTEAGVATLDNTDGDTDGSYSGVYIQNSNLDGKLLKEVNRLGFSFTGVPTAGSPRLTLPIDTNQDGVTEFYISVGAFYCNDGSGNVNAINGSACTIFRNDNGSGPWANWAALVAANPTWRVTSGELPFIIADDPGLWTVSNVQLGKGPARGK